MNTISKSKLKANMLQIFRDLEASGEELIVTDHNRPVLKIIPFQEKQTVEEIFSTYQGQVQYFEDIDTPTTDEWSET
jgi:antitoxin (DNA-binding transcriptional repressor) of toxin-antitoxin stability system